MNSRKKKVLQTNISYCLDLETKLKKKKSSVFRNDSADSFPFFQGRFLWHTVELQQSANPASHPIFTFLQVSCALQEKIS